MAIINFENMKATEPDRNFDNVNVDENYNIGLQNGQGFYGAGKFFGLVQKAVNWISTITGNKNFTGTLSVNSKEVATTESVNNALANYEVKQNIGYVSSKTTYKISFPTGSYLKIITRGCEEVTVYRRTELKAFRNSNTYTKVDSINYAENYLYVTINANAEQTYILTDSIKTIETSTIPTTVTNIPMTEIATENFVNNALADSPIYKTVTATTNENGAILSIPNIDLKKVLSVYCTSDADLICTIFNGSYQYIRVRTYQGTNKANTSVTLNLVLMR